MKRLFAFLVVMLLTTALVAAEEWLSIDVNPRFSVTPIRGTASVRISVMTPKNDQNRVLCFGYDGTIYRSSCQEHVGLRAPRRVQQLFQGLPPGNYVAFAELTRETSDRKAKTQLVTTAFVVCGDKGCGSGM